MKETNISWVPYIPDNWSVVRLKDIARLQSGDGITSVNIDNIGEYPVFGGNGLRGYTDNYTNDGNYVLIGRQGALCGNINYASGKFFASEHAVVVYPHDKNESTTWLGETLRAANLNRLSASAAQPGLAVNVLIFQMIPYPPKEVRKRIGKFLDDKLSKIDEHIELLKKQLDAYSRLKKSLVHQAVTRGLNPNVPFKNSGIEWIGMIPHNWDVKRFKEFARTTKGKQCDYYDTLGNNMEVVLTVETLRQDLPSFYNYGIVVDKRQLCDESDIVVIWDGAGVGEFLKAKKGLLSSTIARIDVNTHKVLKEYLWLWRYNIEYQLKRIPTGMGIPHLNPTILNNYLIPIPPLPEQQAIAIYLDDKCSKIDAAIENIGKQIDASKRLKRALINEVITGQRAV